MSEQHVPMASVPLFFLQELMDLHHDFRAGRLVRAGNPTPQETPAPAPEPARGVGSPRGEGAEAATVLQQMGLFPGYEMVTNNEFQWPKPEKAATSNGEGEE